MNTKQQIIYTLFGVLLVLVGHALSEFVSEAIAQDPVWEQTNGPYGGHIKNLTVRDDGTIFALTMNGQVFRSIDGGASWIRLSKELSNTQVTSLTGSTTFLYISTDVGVFRSADGGDSWTKVNDKLRSANVLAVLGRDLYAGTGGGVFRSIDGGVSWTEFNSGINNIGIYSLGILRTYLFAGSGGVYRSLIEKNSWAKVAAGMPDGTTVYSIESLGASLYAGTNNGVFLSVDDGDFWIKLNIGLPNPDVRSLAVSGTVLYAGTNGGGVFRSVDGGNSWTEVNKGLANLSVYSLAVSGKVLYAGTNGGVFRSIDNGNSWLEVNKGLISTPVTSLLITEKFLYAGTNGGGVFRSVDGGNSWIGGKVYNGLTETYVYSLAVLGNNLYAGTNKGVFRSTDSGDSWTLINKGLTNTNVHSLVVLGSDLYAGTWGLGGGPFRSVDSGNSWIKITSGLPDAGAYVNSLAVLNNDIYIGTNGGVFRSADSGNSWAQAGLANTYVSSLAVAEKVLYAGSDGTFFSADGGNSWTKMGLKSIRVNSLAVSDRVLYVGSGEGVFRSATKINTGLTNTNVTSLVVLGNVLYAGTDGGGVFRVSLDVYKVFGDLTPPSPPTDLKVSAEENIINVSWSPSHDLDVVGYKIYYGSQPGVYAKVIDAKKDTSFAISELLNSPFHFIAVSAYDSSKNESKRSEEVKVVIIQSTSLSFKMSLPQGLSIVSLPVKPTTPFTARGFATKLKSSFVIDLDPVSKKFVAFTPQVHTGEGFTIEGGKGYIVNITSPVETIFEGSGWSKAAPPADTSISSVWAFVVAGIIHPEYGSLSLPAEALRVSIKNQRSGAIQTITVTENDEGRFAVSFVDLAQSSVVKLGDYIEIAVFDSSGRLISGPIKHRVDRNDLRNALSIVSLRLGEIIPDKSALGQNYPNPFNPETWIPFRLSQGSEVRLQIYEATGRLVRSIQVGHLEAGVYENRAKAIYWDGRNDMGERVASGIYYYRLQAGSFSAIRKLAVSK